MFKYFLLLTKTSVKHEVPNLRFMVPGFLFVVQDMYNHYGHDFYVKPLIGEITQNFGIYIAAKLNDHLQKHCFIGYRAVVSTVKKIPYLG